MMESVPPPDSLIPDLIKSIAMASSKGDSISPIGNKAEIQQKSNPQSILDQFNSLYQPAKRYSSQDLSDDIGKSFSSGDILGGVGNSITSILKYLSTPEGLKIASAFVGDPYAKSYMANQADLSEKNYLESENQNRNTALDLFKAQKAEDFQKSKQELQNQFDASESSKKLSADRALTEYVQKQENIRTNASLNSQQKIEASRQATEKLITQWNNASAERREAMGNASSERMNALNATSQKMDTKQTKEQKAISDSDKAISQLETLLEKIPQSKGGAIISPILEATGNAPEEYTQFNSLAKGVAFKVARMLNGSGQLSNQDVRNAEALVPQLSDNEVQRKAKIEGIRKLLGIEKKSKIQSDNNDDSEALAWANAHPKDPRAKEIKRRLGK